MPATAQRPREPAQPPHPPQPTSPRGGSGTCSPRWASGVELQRPHLPPRRPRLPGAARGWQGWAERLLQGSARALPRNTPAPLSAPSAAPVLPGPPEPPAEAEEPSGPSWMGVRGPLRASAPLLRSSEVPPGVAERFILSGYRCPGSSAAQCLLSAFRATNETGNFWTHFVALFVFAFHAREAFGGPGRPLPAGPLEPFYYPLWSYCLGVCGLLAGSSLAHLFNALSLPVREICFYIDYGTISAYTVGASLAYFYYVWPEAGPGPSSGCPGGLRAWVEALYVPASCLAALACTLGCCSTRRRRPRRRYLLRTLIFLPPFLVVSLPVFQKLWGPGGSPGTARRFLRHCLWLLASAVFNVSKAPERFSPGRFDIWGHSHQWLHCCSFLSILEELRMIRGEMELLLAGGPPLRPPTFLSTFGVMLLALALLGTIVAWFGVRAHGGRGQSEGRKGD